MEPSAPSSMEVVAPDPPTQDSVAPDKLLAILQAELRSAYAAAEDAALARERDLASEQERVAAAVSAAAAADARAAALEESAGDGAATARRAAEAEGLVGDLRAEIGRERAKRETVEARLVTAAERDAAAAASVAALEARLAQERQGRVEVQGRLERAESDASGLARSVEERDGQDAERRRRVQFLEEDRLRMAGELAEAESRRGMAEAAREREGAARAAEAEAARAEAAGTRERAAVAEERCAVFERHVAELQAARERARADAAREVENLNGQIEIQREAERDAEKRFREFKTVISGMSAAMKAKDARAVESGGLGVHADALLRHVQTELDARLDDLEAQRAEFDAARAAERKMAVALQALTRERDTAVVAAEDSETRARASEETLQDALRRCDRLERRIMLAGSAGGVGASGLQHMPHLVADGSGGGPGSGGHGVTMMDVVRSGGTPLQIASTPSKFALDANLEEVTALRQRHDDLVSSIAAQRDMYRKMLGNST